MTSTIKQEITKLLEAAEEQEAKAEVHAGHTATKYYYLGCAWGLRKAAASLIDSVAIDAELEAQLTKD